jgi:hypothetical protein
VPLGEPSGDRLEIVGAVAVGRQEEERAADAPTLHAHAACARLDLSRHETVHGAS